MQTQHHYKLSTLLVMFTMVLCVVFASTIKVATDINNSSKKTTTQQLLEEEPNETDTKTSKDVYHKQLSFSELKTNTPTVFTLNLAVYFITKTASPYLKVHTPPPDFFI